MHDNIGDITRVNGQTTEGSQAEPRPVNTEGSNASPMRFMGLLHVLDELDRMQRLLEEEFPECKIGYAYHPGHVTWSAQIGPVLNADSPDALRAAIKRTYAEVLEKIGRRAQGTS